MLKPVETSAPRGAEAERHDVTGPDATIARLPLPDRAPDLSADLPPDRGPDRLSGRATRPPRPPVDEARVRERAARYREVRDARPPADPVRAPRPAEAPRRSPLALGFRALVQLGLMVAVLFGAYTAMQRMIDARPERERRERPQTVYAIRTVPATIADNRPTLDLYGTVVAGREIELRAPASGTIVEVAPALRAGLRVEEGQRLAAIDDFDARTALAEARANLATTRGQIAETRARITAETAQIAASEEQAQLSREEFERTRSLVERGTLPAAQLDQRRLSLSQAEQGVLTRTANRDVLEAQLATQEAGLERLELRVEQAERTLADTVLVAPFSGVIRTANAQVGRDVSPADVLVSLYDDRALEARFLLTDAQYGRVATDSDPLIGRPVTVTWTVGGTPYEFRGTVDRTGAEIATERGGVEAFAAVEPTDGEVRLRPGAFVEVTLPDRTFAGTIRLPETALYDERDVYVNADGMLERRGVVRLAYDGEDAIVVPAAENGLAPGERVMVTRLSRVDAGLAVAEPDDPGAPAPAPPTPRAGAGGRGALIAAVAEAEGMTVEEVRALPDEERRAMIAAYREANGLPAGGPGGPGGRGGDPDRARSRAARGDDT